MKNKFLSFAAVAVTIFTAFAFVGCASKGKTATNEQSLSATSYSANASRAATYNKPITPDTLKNTLQEFMTDGTLLTNTDRTLYTKYEKAAADWIVNYVKNYVDETQVKVQEFEQVEGTEKNVYKSQNVEVYFPCAKESTAYNIIIGASYDNVKSKNELYKDNNSDAVTQGASSVALNLELVRFMAENDIKLDVNLRIVFFGANSAYYRGTQNYLYDIDALTYEKTILYINTQRFGGDYMYAFSDERKTALTEYLDEVVKNNNNIRSVPAMAARANIVTLQGIPYTHWGMEGPINEFFNNNIPTINFISGNMDDFDISNNESAHNKNLSYTADDNLVIFNATYPDAYNQMSSVANEIVNIISDPAAIASAADTRKNFPQTNALTYNWIWYLVVIAIVGILFFVAQTVSKRIAKKYPIKLPTPTKVKLAVFGSEYEDVTDPNTVILDMHSNNQNSDLDPFVFDRRAAMLNDIFGEGLDDPFADSVFNDDKVNTVDDNKSVNEIGKPEAEVQPETSAEPETKSEPENSAEPETKSEPETESEPENKLEINSEPEREIGESETKEMTETADAKSTPLVGYKSSKKSSTASKSNAATTKSASTAAKKPTTTKGESTAAKKQTTTKSASTAAKKPTTTKSAKDGLKNSEEQKAETSSTTDTETKN